MGQSLDVGRCADYCESQNATYCLIGHIQLSPTVNNYYCNAPNNGFVPQIVTQVGNPPWDYAGPCASTPVAAVQAACDIKGGAGAQLVAVGMATRADCQNECQTQASSHPNLTCQWGSTELAAQATCSIKGGAGLQLYLQNGTRGDCFNQCQSLLGTHPNEACVWNGSSLR